MSIPQTLNNFVHENLSTRPWIYYVPPNFSVSLSGFKGLHFTYQLINIFRYPYNVSWVYFVGIC
jgi:hypothetical protein